MTQQNTNFCSEECKDYPYYGVAPHECFHKKGPDHTIGQSTLIPHQQWPDNFFPDLEPREKLEDLKYPSACGGYYCPNCKRGMPK